MPTTLRSYSVRGTEWLRTWSATTKICLSCRRTTVRISAFAARWPSCLHFAQVDDDEAALRAAPSGGTFVKAGAGERPEKGTGPILFGTRFASPKKKLFGTPCASLLHQHWESVKMAGGSHGGQTKTALAGRTSATAEAAGTGPLGGPPPARPANAGRETRPPGRRRAPCGSRTRPWSLKLRIFVGWVS